MRYRPSVDAGSVADWVNASGTLLAFGGAVFASVVALRSYRIQMRGTEAQVTALESADLERRLERERSQATRIALWTGVNSGGPAVWYVNQSGLPAYDMTILVLVPGVTHRFTYRALGPSDQEKVLGRIRRELISDEPGDDFEKWREFLGTGRFLCAVTFRDAANNWWLRNSSGELVRQADGDLAAAALAGEAGRADL